MPLKEDQHQLLKALIDLMNANQPHLLGLNQESYRSISSLSPSLFLSLPCLMNKHSSRASNNQLLILRDNRAFVQPFITYRSAANQMIDVEYAKRFLTMDLSFQHFLSHSLSTTPSNIAEMLRDLDLRSDFL